MKTMEMDKINKKIKNLIKNAGKYEDMQVRLLLEELIREGGRDAENLISEFALRNSILEPVRINLIRSMGYITSTNFLMTLKKILEGDYSVELRKAAIISISKYNDKRALNILNSALKRIYNPILQESISKEISRIQEANPILSLLPKFIKGGDDPKTFRTTLEILKKILNPADAHVFIYHLDSESPFVGDGAFEVLCWRGDESVKFSIFDFFRKKLKLIDCIDDKECCALEDLLAKLEKYVTRNPDTINYILKELKFLYKKSSDIKIKELLINMFSSSHKREVLPFLEDIYNTEPDRREFLIDKLSGNEGGAFILIYKYKNDPQMTEKLIPALMTTKAGADYLIELFDTMEPGYQQLLLDLIQDSNYIFFRQLIERFLLSNEVGDKKFALDKIRNFGDSQFFDILFDPGQEKEFLRMQNDYLLAISQVFFIKTFKFFFNRLVDLDTARPMIRRYLGQKDFYILFEPVIGLEPSDNLAKLANTIVNFNNKDLNLDVLKVFCSLKTFDYNTYQKFQDFLKEFKNLRGSRISPNERGLLNKAGTNLKNINDDLKAVEKGNTRINHFLEKNFPDYELLESILKNHHLSFFIHRKKLCDRIKKVFKLTNDIDAFNAIKFFHRRPDFCIYFKEEIRQCTESSNHMLKNDAEILIETMPKDLRFVLIFENRLLYCCFEDQLKELMPEYEVTRDPDIQPTDILITDTRSILDLVSENRLNTQKLYVLLKDKEEFTSIKDLNPRVFPPPLSFSRVMKAIITDMFPV